MRRKIGHYLKNEKGMALAVVLMVIVVFSILGMGLIGVALTNSKLASVERSNKSAYYIAEAGATYQLKEISDKINSAYTTATDSTAFFNTIATELTTSAYNNFDQEYGKSPSATAQIQDVTQSGSAATTKQYKITSVGTVGNQKATVTQTFSVNYVAKTPVNPLPNMTVFTTSQGSTNASIDLENSGMIYGSAGTSAGANSITMSGHGGNRIVGDIYYVGPQSAAGSVVKILTNGITLKSTPQPVNSNSVRLPDFPIYPSYPVPSDSTYNNYSVIKSGALTVNSKTTNYTLQMNSNMSFSSITVNNNNTLTINTGNSDRSIVVDSLNVDPGNVVITGTGKLTIYVNSSFTVGSGSINKTLNGSSGDASKLNIYYAGSTALNFANDMLIYGNLFAKQADVTITAGSSFTGTILSGGQHFTVNGGTSNYTQLFFAPNADFYLSEGGKIVGNVISKTFKAEDAGSITYQSINTQSLPFFPSDWFTSSSSGPSAPNLITSNPMREIK
jgi:Tfp pilus assembly protein PilX